MEGSLVKCRHPERIHTIIYYLTDWMKQKDILKTSKEGKLKTQGLLKLFLLFLSSPDAILFSVGSPSTVQETQRH